MCVWFLFFWTEWGFIGESVGRGGSTNTFVSVTGPAICPGATIGMEWTDTVWDEPRFSRHVFKLICMKLSRSPLLGGVDLLAARELELGPASSLGHRLLALQLSADRRDYLAEVDPGHRAWRFPKAPAEPSGVRQPQPRTSSC